MPQELGVPEQDGLSGAPPATLEAKTDNFLVSFFDPHLGQGVAPSQFLERTSTSESFPHFPQ